MEQKQIPTITITIHTNTKQTNYEKDNDNFFYTQIVIYNLIESTYSILTVY